MIGKLKDFRCDPGWFAAAAIALGVVAAVVSYPMSFGWTARGKIDLLYHLEGHAWTADLPGDLVSPRGRNYLLPEIPRIYENGSPLEQVLDDKRKIQRGGWGRYQVSNGRVILSSSDGASPAGREYEVEVGGVQVPEAGLLAIWGSALVLGLLALRSGFGSTWRDYLGLFPGHIIAMTGGIAWIVWALVNPLSAADPFFSGLAAPAAWAAGLATMAQRGGKKSFLPLVVFALIPSAASYVHYAIGGASHDSFLVAGAVPWSDAWVHFFQAAQISISGATEQAFNGRFLYPLFLSGLLPITAWNLQLALAVVTGVCLLGVALLCRSILPLSGWTGSALVALGSWFFLRSDVAGIVMSEGLGFAGGVFGLAAIIVAWPKRSWFLFFVGLFVLSLGMAARPGAVFVLPAIGLAAALREFASATQGRLLRSVAVLLCSVFVVAAPFVVNLTVGRCVSASGAAPFNNFAFSFHGLLTGKRWSDSAQETKSPDAAMQRSIELLRAEPWLLLKGISRAWGFTWRSGFMFHFGEERRLKRTMFMLALVGLPAMWLLPRWRGQHVWVWSAAAGLCLSLPFAPPWDAGLRAYAATVPLQCVLSGAGLTLLLGGLRRLGSLKPTFKMVSLGPPETLAYVSCAILILFSVVWPVGRAVSLTGVPPVADPHAWPPDFRAGSSRPITNAYEYRRSLAAFLADQGGVGSDYLRIGQGAILGVDWHRLAVVAVDSPISATAPDFVQTDWIWIDPIILDTKGTRTKQQVVPAKH